MKLLKNARVLGYHEIIENKESRKLIQNLIGDDDNIKYEYIKKDCGLDILINDSSWRIRRAVAKRGYRLDVLVCDKNDGVRMAVAGQGYGLDVLAHDRDGYVLRAVHKYMSVIPPMNTSGSIESAVV